MSSCQDFLMPPVEGGVAVGMEPRLPTASFIKLEERSEMLVDFTVAYSVPTSEGAAAAHGSVQ